MHSPGQVYLVGAGPGDPGLLTVRGRRLLRKADVVVYDRLANPLLLCETRPDAELIEVGKARGADANAQELINAVLIERARRGLIVVRLKGGDPLVFGRGGEELTACREAGLACGIIPGVSSALAAPAAVGVPVTHRGIARSVSIVTGETLCGEAPGHIAALAGSDTIVVLMGRARLAEIARQLIAAGQDPATPALCVERATLAVQRQTTAALRDLPAAVERAGLQAPVVIVVGVVVRFMSPEPALPRGPLQARRIVVTRPPATSRRLHRLLEAQGADVIACPLISIDESVVPAALDEALRGASRLDWIVLTSAQAARTLRQRLRACGLDARSLAGCRIAALGSATAGVLQRHGLRADLQPPRYTAADLLASMEPLLRSSPRRARVLYPHSDLSSPELAQGLRNAGAEVIDIVAYANRRLQPPAGCRSAMARGVDAVLFYSPSAVHSYRAAALQCHGAAIVCIGPRTAAAARSHGLDVAVVAEPHTDAGVVAGLCTHFARACDTEPPTTVEAP